VCEKLLHDHLSVLEKQERQENLRDGPNRLALPPIMAPENMQHIIVAMDEAIKSPGTEDEKQVCLSKGDGELMLAGRGYCGTNVDVNRTMEEGG